MGPGPHHSPPWSNSRPGSSIWVPAVPVQTGLSWVPCSSRWARLLAGNKAYHLTCTTHGHDSKHAAVGES
jgi:hypothetical protein